MNKFKLFISLFLVCNGIAFFAIGVIHGAPEAHSNVPSEPKKLSLFEQAVALIQQGKEAEAKALYDDQAMELVGNGKYEEAEKILKDAQDWWSLGFVLEKQEKYEEAEKLYREHKMLRLPSVLEKLGKYKEAEKLFEDSKGWIGLFRVANRLKNWEKAELAAKKLLEERPDFSSYERLAQIYIDSNKNLKEVEKLLNKAYESRLAEAEPMAPHEKGPWVTVPLRKLAKFLIQQGKGKEGEAVLKKAITIEKHHEEL